MIILSHFIFVIGNFLSIFILPFCTQWWIYIPIITWEINLIFSRSLECPATRLENYLRTSLGMPTISTFVKHYFIKPTVKLRKKLLVKWKKF